MGAWEESLARGQGFSRSFRLLVLVGGGGGGLWAADSSQHRNPVGVCARDFSTPVHNSRRIKQGLLDFILGRGTQGCREGGLSPKLCCSALSTGTFPLGTLLTTSF